MTSIISPSLEPLLSDRLTMGFIGMPDPKSGLENPGSPDTDPEYANKLRGIFGEDRETIYPTCDHSGSIISMSNCLDFFPAATSCYMGTTSSPGVVTPHADAVVVHYEVVPEKVLKKLTVAIRAWDCGNIIAHNPKQQAVALIHASIETMFGYHSGKGGGIIDEVIIGFCGNPKDTYVALGPCISGVANRVHACYEFGEEDSDRLFSLIAGRYSGLPLDNLLTWKSHDSDKVNLAFGEIIIRTLGQCGILRNHIDLSCNHCTLDTKGWYSYRRTLALKREMYWFDKKAGDKIERQLEYKFGNLAFVSFS